jgi:pimeloyl-ACP methyl ester carboxylesterase
MSFEIIERNGLAIEVDLQGGSGPLVVMIPAMGRGGADFFDLSAALTRAGYRTAAVNPRGAGRSHGPVTGLTLHDLAADLSLVIEEFNGTPAGVIGHAFGNRVARCLAADRPDLVRCLVLLAAGGKTPPSPEFVKALEILQSKETTEIQRREATKKAYFARDSNPDFFLSGNWSDTLRAQGEASRNTPLEAWWAGGQAPILILQGLEDLCALPANGRQLKEKFGDRITLEEIPNAAHALLSEQPALIAQKIIDYLDRHLLQQLE